jgi:hypothetical protein
MISKLSSYEYADRGASWDEKRQDKRQVEESERKVLPNALVETFDAEIDLTPKLSVGTATPESIYVADFKASITAQSPLGYEGKSQIELPLPPRVISLAELDIKVNGDTSEDFNLRRNRLIWEGVLSSENSSQINVNYSAIGKGIYTLEKPSGKIIDLFKTKLIANRSNIRMLELSLQPNGVEYSSDQTTYTWEYKRLVVGQPIAIDVLGVAGIDRLSELTWLGPLSVLVFGILIALTALAYDPEKLTGWVLVLLVGCFAGGYPLMYFLQDFVPLWTAIVISALIIVAVVLWRMTSLCGFRHGIFGGLVLPIAVLLLTVSAAVVSKRAMQGGAFNSDGYFHFCCSDGITADSTRQDEAGGSFVSKKGRAVRLMTHR